MHTRKNVLILVTVFVLGMLLWWRLHVGLIRQYDVDEFAYLHWAYNLNEGKMPYVDFFSYTTPGYLGVYQVLFLFGKDIAPLVAGRIVSFLTYLTICVGLGMLLVHLYGKSVFAFFLPPLFLTALPLPADKFIEIRPDIVVLAMAVWAIVLYVKDWWFLSGFLYSLSFVVFNKTAPFIAAALLITMVDGKRKKSFFLGLLVPILALGMWALSTGGIEKVWYSLISLPFEIAKSTAVPWKHMSITLFFHPNAFFYGQDGWGPVILVNHAVWFIGLMAWVIAFLTPWVDSEKSAVVRGRALVALSTLFSILAFYYLYQMRHAQYLMPIAVFVAFYLSVVFVNSWKSTISALLFLAITVGLVITGQTWYQAKLKTTNVDTHTEMRLLWKIIPENAYVFDLDCRSLYYKDPYPISCLPFYDFIEFMSQRPPPVEGYIENQQPLYIYVDRLGRIDTLLLKHVRPHPDYSRILVYYTLQ